MSVGTEPINSTNCTEVSINELRCGINLLTDNDAELTADLLNYAINAWEKEAKLQLEVKKGAKSVFDAVLARTARHEARRHYRTLRRNMRNANIKKHTRTSAHHIVSWRHPQAKAARAILKSVGICLDDAENGVYLPRFKKDIPHKNLPSAYPHSIVHTGYYYLNVTQLLMDEIDQDGSKEDIVSVLQYIAHLLQDGKFPIDKKMRS